MDKIENMHKLLERQLRLYRDSASIPEEWQSFIKAVNEAYLQADQDQKLVERSLEISSEELLSRNEELANTLAELKQMQTRLVHSEKMAVLGQLIAGINHEINTPAGAIMGAAEELKRDYLILLKQLIELIKDLPKNLYDSYLKSCEKTLQFDKELTTEETRTIAKNLEEALKNNDINDVHMLARNLAKIGFTVDNVGEFIELLKDPQAEKIVSSLYNLGMSRLHVADIQIAIERIVRLAKALRMYTHKDKDGPAYTDLKEDLNNTLIIFHNKLKKAMTIKQEFADIPKLKCYADQLSQVWSNIINNAIEATEGTGEIFLRLSNQQDEVVVEIQDNGPGISGETLPHIFEPYFTTKPKGEGTGLGLSISKEIVDRHQGEISVKSEPGKTIFKVILPLSAQIANQERM